MISYLEGQVKWKGPNCLILVAHGVGYKIFLPTRVLANVAIDTAFSVYTYTYVREDALDLYGFSSHDELSLYELFLTVSGIGPKTALAIFSVATAEKIKYAILSGDVEFFAAIPRLGKKNAQKIIIELRTKLGSLEELDISGDGMSAQQEVVEALKGFGFSVSEAREALRALPEHAVEVSDRVRLALKYLGKKK